MFVEKKEEGQAIILVALAMAIFLIGAVGLAIDGSHLYSQRQMAQTAADSAAIAAMMSIYDGTNGTGTTAFTVGTQFTCTQKPNSTPCQYASKDGFGLASDTVTVSFPPDSAVPGVSFYGSANNLVQVQVSRSVDTTLMRFLGPTATTVQASAMAAIVSVTSPVPILILHPTLASSLELQGTPSITICGGPTRSIQVNSSNSGAFAPGGSWNIDLSHAGPPDTGNCLTGTGADFAVKGGPNPTGLTCLGSPGNSHCIYLGTTPGNYVFPASPMDDPLLGVIPPTTANLPSQTQAGYSLNAGQTGPTGTPAAGITCPTAAGSHGCTVLSPGLYAAGISLSNTTALFKPGIYYIQSGGFNCGNNCNEQMVSGTADPAYPGGTGTGWDGTVAGGGMMVYNTGTGQFNLSANGSVDLIGSPASSAYQGILFFEDHTAARNNKSTSPNNPHKLGGGGDLTLRGTIYLTNTAASDTSSLYQELDLSGNSGNTTTIQGEIIVDKLTMGGTGGITMNLSSTATYTIRQVALVQ